MSSRGRYLFGVKFSPYWRIMSPAVWDKTRVISGNGQWFIRINLPLLSTVLPSNSWLFLSCRPFVVITFSTGLVRIEITSISSVEVFRVHFRLTGKVINTFKYHVFAPTGRYQLELIYLNFPPSFHLTVACPSQEAEVTSTLTIPVENVVRTTKGLQDRNNLLLDERTMENKGKLILTEIFPSVQKHDI